MLKFISDTTPIKVTFHTDSTLILNSSVTLIQVIIYFRYHSSQGNSSHWFYIDIICYSVSHFNLKLYNTIVMN